MSNILIIPASGIIGFDTSTAGTNYFSPLSVGPQLAYDGGGGLNIKSFTTASTALNRLTIDGAQGRLFSVTDVLTGSLMSVNDIAGLPILEVFDTPAVVMGAYNSNAFVLSGSQLGLGINPTSTTSTLVVSGNTTIYGNLSATNFIGNITGTITGLATKASTLAQGGGNGTGMTFNWSGQSGQPTWLWGGNDGVNHYVYNPSNFNVNSAASANCSQCVWSYDNISRNPSNVNPTTTPYAVRFDFVQATNAGNPGSTYGGVMTYSPWLGTTASTGDASYQLAFLSTATNGTGIPYLNIRNGIDSTWNSWYTLLHTGSVNASVPANFCAGTGCTGSVASPAYISTGNSLSNGNSPASLKYKLYDDGTASNRFGFTIGPNADVQYHASNSSGSHNFYVNGSTNIGCFNSNGLTVAGVINANGGNSNQWNTIYQTTSTTAYTYIGGTSSIRPVNGFNTASGIYSVVTGGKFNQATGNCSFIGGGCNNTASGNYSSILGGYNNKTNSQNNAFIIGSNLTACAANFTYVNNLSSVGFIVANNIQINSGPSTFVNPVTASGTFLIVNVNGTNRAIQLWDYNN